LIRRERSYAGINFDPVVVGVDASYGDDTSRIFNTFYDLSRAVSEYLATPEVQQWMFAKGYGAVSDPGVGDPSLSSVDFGSVMHNLSSQIILASKVVGAIDKIKQSMASGEAVVISVSKTMEAALQDIKGEQGLGTVADADFRAAVERTLDRLLTVSFKAPSGEIVRIKIDPDDQDSFFNNAQGLALRAALHVSEVAIDESKLADLPVSPIDYIFNELQGAGYSGAELTGRSLKIDYSDDDPKWAERKEADSKEEIRRKFNSGKLDFVLLNRSSATGVSLHASEKNVPEGQKPRHMFVLEPEDDVNVFMQVLGRVNRSGQVNLPRYSFVMTSLPMELRPAAAIMRKLRSLNANVSADTTGSLKVDLPDIMNIVGGAAIREVFLDEIETLRAMRLGPLSPQTPAIDIVKMVTGRMVLLPVEEQRKLWERILESYNRILAGLKASGTNPLEAEFLDLQAEVIASQEVNPPIKKNSRSPFFAGTILEKVSIRALKRPLSKLEILERIAGRLKIEGDAATLDQSVIRTEAKRRLTSLSSEQGIWVPPTTPGSLQKKPERWRGISVSKSRSRKAIRLSGSETRSRKASSKKS